MLYTRVSDDKQEAANQLAQLRPWAHQRRWVVEAEEVDRITGDERRRRGDPPGLRRALRMLELRQVEVLAVWAADRLVRSPTGLVNLVARVQQLGGQVASYQDGADLDTTTDTGELLTFFRGWWARMELKLIRARTLAGLERARAAGKQLGRKPVTLRGGGTTGLLAGRVAGESWAELGRLAGVSASTARRRYMAVLDAASGGGGGGQTSSGG